MHKQSILDHADLSLSMEDREHHVQQSSANSILLVAREERLLMEQVGYSILAFESPKIFRIAEMLSNLKVLMPLRLQNYHDLASKALDHSQRCGTYHGTEMN